MIRYNTNEDKLEMSYEDICMTLHDCSKTLDCSTGYGGTYEAIVEYIDKLQNNWNELKKWLEECLNEIKQNDVYDRTSYEQGQIIALESSIAKVQELEQGKDENN